MKEVLLLKYGEIVLKGLNRGYFNSVLEKRVRRALKTVDGEFYYDYAQSTLCIKYRQYPLGLRAIRELAFWEYPSS
mgnify:CR=1 FL=1